VIPHSVRLLNQGQISCHHVISTAMQAGCIATAATHPEFCHDVGIFDY